jgi:tetratricopeptide (TPR) repeat protein
VPRLAREVYADLRGASTPGHLADVVRAYAAAGDALEDVDITRAVELLSWARGIAPRSAVLREALGVAHYLAGNFAAAHAELLTYRRLSGRYDQNHLLADCARAAGRHDKVAEYVEEMFTHGVEPDRIAEGLIVLGGDRADRGDLEGALATLERAGLHPVRVQPYHARVWYAAADLCERLGDRDRARGYLEAVAAVHPDFLDAADRLAALDNPEDR